MNDLPFPFKLACAACLVLVALICRWLWKHMTPKA